MKKIFIVAPHFPPSALPPAQRVRLLVKHLHQFNYYPYVFTTHPKYREEPEDEWMVELAGNNFSKITVRSLNQHYTRKMGIGDLGLRMLPFLFPRLLIKALKEKPDFILYPVPPWYIMVIAPVIKFFTSIPYGIDFIDPWVEGGKLPSDAGPKKVWSQRIARILECWVAKKADIIYAVSEGINENLLQRCSAIKNKPLLAIPYGVEPDDFLQVKPAEKPSDKVIIRYIGAVWDDAYPVLDVLMEVLKEISLEKCIQVEFYGTTYAAKELASSQLGLWVEKYGLEDIVYEYPLRVSYKRAVELTLGADIVLLFGGMQPYYAASKLFGLIASGKPFLAFLHRNSFPALTLDSLMYKYIVSYSEQENDQPMDNYVSLLKGLNELIKNKDTFVPIDMSSPVVQENTAYGMTKKFIEPVNKLLVS